jgi:Flp pilus assembly protein TadD
MALRTLVLLLLLSACAAAPEAPSTMARRAPESAGEAMQALADGRYDDAGRRFGRILAEDPSHREARLGMAEVHLAQGRAREALPIFDSLVTDPLMRPLALQGRGLALLALGRRAPAAASLAEAAASSTLLWRAWNGLGRIADAEKRWADADAAYARAVAAAPRSAMVYANLGYSLLLRGMPHEAEKALRVALSLEPGMPAAVASLRLALAWQGRYLDALSGVRGGELPQVLNDVGYIAFARGDLETAETYLLRSLALSPRHLAQADSNLAAVRAARTGR